MIKKSISRSTFQEHLITLIKDELAIEAIKDDGIYSTFKFDNKYFPPTGITKTTLQYLKRDIINPQEALDSVYKIMFYNCCPELGDVTLPYICAEVQQKVADRIKMDLVKNDNAIWSTIKIQPRHDHFDISYEKVHVNEPMTAQEIENTKKTLRRIQENSYYGLYPRHSGLTCYFDEKSKEDLKASLKTWKAKAEACDSAAKSLGFVDAETLRRISEKFSYGSHNKEEKEKKDMNVTLMVVPNGMNKDFVNKVKANFQSNNSIRLFVASTDIGFSCPYGTTRTKYDLFEDWVKRGKVDIVYFMLGFEKDPDVRAFESFVRGITEAEVPGKVDVRVVYQKDDILNDVNNLRTAYFDKADAIEDLRNAGDKVIKEEKTMHDIYGLDDKCLDAIRNSKGQIDASDELVTNKIMDTAFADDDDTKPAKKGGKK